jgi:transcription-repair coupling factor (superfamily II helicase)
MSPNNGSGSSLLAGGASETPVGSEALVGEVAEVPANAEGWLSKIEETASPADRDREYLSRREWSLVTKRMSVLPLKAPYHPTPDFSKLASPGKALRAYVSKAQKNGARLLFVSAHDDDLRSMERMGGVRIERFCDWRGATAARVNAAVLADFDRGFLIAGRKTIIVVTGTDVLGSRAHHQPMAKAWTSAFDKMAVPQVGTIVVHLQRGLSDYIARVGTGS